MATLGVEEEFLLLDADSGLPVARSAAVRRAAGRMPSVEPREVEPELLQAQIEVGTPVCGGLDEVAEQLVRLRAAVAAAAAGAGCRLAATGTAPAVGRTPVPVTAKARYQAMSGEAPQLVDEQLINGMHVHVAIPDRDSGVGVLNRIRPWLPVLVALGANSPLWEGGDTGFASWRTLVFGRWPVSGPPPHFGGGADDYDTRTRALVDAGAILDRGQIYWQARLSERYPTVEIRALDVQLEIGDAVALAGLVRALVHRSLAEHRSGSRVDPVPPELLAAATWHAARYGLDEELIDARSGRGQPAAEVVAALLEHVSPALEECGDLERVCTGVERLLTAGNGAQRQRRTLIGGDLGAVTELITVRG
ncbi:carboxylate-amine ligase [Streptacidiphilus carbonis]|uniref:carboxylate-amine ligase n=1 Tax=Streptacidiphilus carbonis TaxID=105422 RepID=UPI0005A960D4|nr:glutamate--cysteine ligase [Streptacidiphilus carbonis]